jgi:hypothetical protein
MDCPLCGKALEVDDDMSGQTAACPECGGEVYLDPDDAARHAREDRAAASSASRDIQTMRAAGIAFAPTTMPPITWLWAFDTVLKLTIAIAVIDGILLLVISILRQVFGR